MSDNPIDHDPVLRAGLPRAALLEFATKLERRLVKRGPEKIPYMWRAYLGRVEGEKEPADGIGAFLHEFVSSDQPDELHCHPWEWSVSFILDGSYREERADGQISWTPEGEGSALLTVHSEQTFVPGTRNIITASTFHKVDLLTPSVWTLFIHGPRVQPWGFVPARRYGESLPMRVIKRRTIDLPAEP